MIFQAYKTFFHSNTTETDKNRDAVRTRKFLFDFDSLANEEPKTGFDSYLAGNNYFMKEAISFPLILLLGT